MSEPMWQVWAQLTDRDRRIIELLRRHKVLTTEHLLALEFDSITRAQTRLLQLFNLGVLTRFRFQRLGGGSYPWHYALGYGAARLIAARKGVRPPRPTEHAERLTRIGEAPTLGHLLGVNGFFAELAGYARTARWPNPNEYGGTGLTAWRSEAEITKFHERRVRPDGFGCWSEHGTRLGFYLEYDTGTETLPTVAKKLDFYNGHYEVVATTLHGMLLFTVATARREAGLRRALAKKHSVVPIATSNRQQPGTEGPAGPVWAPLSDGPAIVRRVSLGGLAAIIGGTTASGKPLVLTSHDIRLEPANKQGDYFDIDDSDWIELPDGDDADL